MDGCIAPFRWLYKPRVGVYMHSSRQCLVFEGRVLRLAICSDEVFAKNQTILITVDPVSLAILQIELSKDRKSESWSAHWKCLAAEGYEIVTLCNDEGTGMAGAQGEALPDTAR